MKITSAPFTPRQSGFTLVEIMIAMVLGLIIVAGVIQIFISNNQAYRVTDSHSKLQDNARFALEVLSRDIRSAGFSGCRAIEDMNVVTIADAPVPATIDANTVITGNNGSPTVWTPALPAVLGAVVVGTDVITVQRGQSCGGNLVGNIGSSNGNIQIFNPNTCSVSAGDVLMIADCTDAHVSERLMHPLVQGNKLLPMQTQAIKPTISVNVTPPYHMQVAVMLEMPNSMISMQSYSSLVQPPIL